MRYPTDRIVHTMSFVGTSAYDFYISKAVVSVMTEKVNRKYIYENNVAGFLQDLKVRELPNDIY